MSTEIAIVPYRAPSMGEAINAVERWGRLVHHHQRMVIIDNLSVPEKVARYMREVNRSLSSPDEQKELDIGRRGGEMLRNASIKSQFASFLALEGLIERLSQLTRSQGIIDETLSSPNIQAQMDFNQLIAQQRSQHTQTMEILQFLDKKKFDGLHQVLATLSNQEVAANASAALEDLAKLKPGNRDRINKLLTKIITVIASKPDVEAQITQNLELPPAPGNSP